MSGIAVYPQFGGWGRRRYHEEELNVILRSSHYQINEQHKTLLGFTTLIR
jgi:hypothetical protein